MQKSPKAKVIMNGDAEAVCLPPQFRLDTEEVYIRRDEKTGDVILSHFPDTLAEILQELHKIDIPEDFLSPAERNGHS